MSLPSPYIESYHVADGVTTSFPFGAGFTAPSAANVKCIIYFSDETSCIPTFNVDITTGYITIVTLTKPDGTVLTVPPEGSIVRIFRDTPEQQNVSASQLQNYTAKQLERIFDSIVAMIQEVSFLARRKTIRLTETQRDVSVEQLTEEKDQGIIYWDFETRQLKATDYGQDEVVKSETVDRLVYLQPEGKIYFIPKGTTTQIPVGAATIHNDLSGRNAPDCHPESAITNLTTHLQELRDSDNAIEHKAEEALSKASESVETANDAKDIAQDAKDIADSFDDRLTQAEQDASDAKDIAQDASDAVSAHITDTNNPHSVTASQVGLGNVDNTSDADKPISDATQSALDGLQDEIDDLKGLGRFLSVWNCATGLAETNPPTSPYTYNSGDYFLVGTVDSTTNYKPDGVTYTTGVASTTVEIAEVKVNDVYIYDGTNWKLQANSQRQYTFSGIAGSPYDNTNLGNALNGKVDETSTANQVYGTDNNGDQTTYNITDFGAVDDVKVNNVSVVTSKIANIDLTSYLKNIATATDAISVLGTANTSWTNGINIGKDSRINSNNGVAIGVDASADVNAVGIGRDTDAGVRGTAIGAYAKTSYDTGIAIGCWNSNTNNAVSSAKGAYQFGVGTNNTARTLNIGWYDDSVSPSTFRNYQLLDGNTGLIPDARISTNIARTVDIPTVNDATLTIQKNGTDIDTFTANSATNKTVNITVPTTPGDIGAQAALTAGTNIQITGTTISATDTTYSNFTGASAGDAGASGLVPAPAAGDQGKFLQGDGTWANPTMPTVNDATITITQGGVTKGSFTLNQASGDTIALDAGGGSSLPSQTGNAGKFLTTDGTDASWSNKPLVNTATGNNSLSILGTASTQTNAVNVGKTSSAYKYGTAIGHSAAAGWTRAIAIGYRAQVSAQSAIQIGSVGGSTTTNSGANTFKVANDNGNFEIMSANGTIPEARLADITSATAGQVLTLDSNLDATWANPTATTAWGNITGTLSDQTDLQSALDAKLDADKAYYPDLFDWKWADHEISDMSWLRADTFSWQDGTVYSDAYDHLADDISGKTLQTETVGGTTISFYLADDGHKICPATQESNVTAIYTATGVAWYYILDTDNTRFKLPRTKFGVTGLRDTVGKYVAPGLPNITGYSRGNCDIGNPADCGGAIKTEKTSTVSYYGTMTSNWSDSFDIDASRSNSIYGNSTTVQPPATQQYLYFYVGQFSQSAVEQTAGLNASLFNGKADTDLDNLSSGGEERVFQPGIVLPFAGSTAPSGWLVCDGSAISRTTYAGLFATIGTTYGVGDGSTTFNLPNISDCFVQGGTPGTTRSAGLPNITGDFSSDMNGSAWLGFYANGALYGVNQTSNGGKASSSSPMSNSYQNVYFDASRSSSIYGNSTTVQPKSVEMLYCIKY